ncbi:hypothetical protein C7475_101669 [Chitinophaga sp. S165]|nr:hypothetical protein C7475_101669 [Chitinophaga sp. S165]
MTNIIYATGNMLVLLPKSPPLSNLAGFFYGLIRR